MANLIPTRPTLHQEVEEEFRQFQLDMLACESCGDYHPEGLHFLDITPLDPEEPAEA